DNAIAPRERHLTAVPDPGTVATVEPDSFTPTDIDDDPTVAAALHVRALVLFWWRTATVAVVVIITAAVAFTTASVAVGIAWTAYGTGWVAYSTWTAYGRPRGRDLYTGYRARRSA
ncbi:MAG: hypothetical protein HOQ24_12140, partial [Mycobacteriaceae bacterium]|nr:hypothetical protein [Mycobacteriaceae bacterium]